MTETTGLSALRPSSEELRQQLVHRYAIARPSMTAFVFVGVATLAAFTSFGIEWALLAGASAWEAAVWPVAVTAATLQALYCRVRMTPGWYPSWARWLFEIVATAGLVLAGVGLTLNLDGHPRELGETASLLVVSVPGWSLIASVVVAATFALAVRPPMPSRAQWIREMRQAKAPEAAAALVDSSPFGLPDLLGDTSKGAVL